MTSTNSIDTLPTRPAAPIGRLCGLAVAGSTVWSLHALQEFLFRPVYWHPTTAIDYAAVAGTTLAWLLLGAVLALLPLAYRLGHPRRMGWILFCAVGALGFLLGGTSNFFEDWLGFRLFGDIFVMSNLSGMIGLIGAGLSAIGADGPPVGGGWPLFLAAAGMGLIDLGGGLLIGLALAWLAVRAKGGR